MSCINMTWWHRLKPVACFAVLFGSNVAQAKFVAPDHPPAKPPHQVSQDSGKDQNSETNSVSDMQAGNLPAIALDGSNSSDGVGDEQKPQPATQSRTEHENNGERVTALNSQNEPSPSLNRTGTDRATNHSAGNELKTGSVILGNRLKKQRKDARLNSAHSQTKMPGNLSTPVTSSPKTAEVKSAKESGNTPVATPPPASSEAMLEKANNDTQNQLDQGLIDAQIDDVLGSDEFLQLQLEVYSDKSQNQGKTDVTNPAQQKNESEPEALLKQLDQSDLMDYVAEDDFWKEQLTIEDEPG